MRKVRLSVFVGVPWRTHVGPFPFPSGGVTRHDVHLYLNQALPGFRYFRLVSKPVRIHSGVEWFINTHVIEVEVAYRPEEIRAETLRREKLQRATEDLRQMRQRFAAA